MENIRQVVKPVWGYDALLPLQAGAIGAVLARRDSIVILLTGGGEREFACGPAGGSPSTKVGTVSQPLRGEAKQRGWLVISMKKDWKGVFTFKER